MARRFQRPLALPRSNLAQPFNPTVQATDYQRINGQPNSAINGQMDIWQRGTSFASLGNGAAQYGADRFKFLMGTTAGTAAVVTYSQSADVPTPQQAGIFLNYSAKVLFTTAASSLATNDYAILRHVIEGYDFRQLLGAPMVLSFWVKASAAGLFTIMFQNSAGSMSYVVEYQVSNPNTWEKKTVILPAPQPASFNVTNLGGLYIDFNIARNYTSNSGQPNLWTQSNVVQTSNQFNGLMTTTNATFQLAGVKLEPGVIVTPFQPVNFAQELTKCFRYCFALAGNANASLIAYGKATSATNIDVVLKFPTRMRNLPVFSYLGGAPGHLSGQDGAGTTVVLSVSPTIANTDVDSSYIICTSLGTWAVGGGLLFFNGSAVSTDILIWDAEL